MTKEALAGYNGRILRVNLDATKFQRAKSFYYTLMGWDAKGVPLPEKVEELCIE